MIKSWIISLLLKIMYPRYDIKNETNKGYILKLGFFQKLVGINRKVSWPVHFTSVIKAPHKLKFMNTRPGSAAGCYLDARNGIELGENVIIGPHVSVISMNHDTNDFNEYKQQNPVKIGNNSWLGARSIVLAGVELGEHTIVAAGAVVTKSFTEGNIVVGGNPAKIIKKLSSYNSKDQE